MNNHLLLLLDASENSTPTMRPEAQPIHRRDTDVVMMSFSDAWQDVGSSEVAGSCRKGQTVTQASAVQVPSSRPSLATDTLGADVGGGGARRSIRFDLVDEQFSPPNGTEEMKFPGTPAQEIKLPQLPAQEITFPRSCTKVSRL